VNAPLSPRVLRRYAIPAPVQTQSLKNWLWKHLRANGMCLAERGGESCVRPSGHLGEHECRENGQVFADFVKGRI
jgi:hypothetical protein